MIRISKEEILTNNKLNYSWTPNQAGRPQMQELLIREVINIQLIQTISKATYLTWRKLQLETRSHEETHHILEEPAVMWQDNLQLEQ